MITHGHITVNGRRVNIPSYLVRPGDVIRVKNRPKSLQLVQAILAERSRDVPDFLSLVGGAGARRPRPPLAGSGRRFDPGADAPDRRALLQVTWPSTGIRRNYLDIGSEASPMRIRWRGLELPSLVMPERSTLSATYGKFVAEPFERGFRRDRRQQPAPHPAFQPGRQRGDADQAARRPARVHHPARRGGGRDRHRAQRQVAGGEEPQRADPRGPHREEHQAARSPAPTSRPTTRSR